MSDISYDSAGVAYDILDTFKRLAQQNAGLTNDNVGHFKKIKPVFGTRGESVFLIDAGDSYIGHIEETLGTKNLVADRMYELTGKSYYDHIAIDTVAAIINDLISLGALPVSCAMHLAAGRSEWFEDEARVNDLVTGWKQACDESMCVWGGGETPALKGIVEAGTVLLSGSAVGVIEDKTNLISGDISDGDAIVMVASHGIHANGLSLARMIAEKHPDGYGAKMSDGRGFGEGLLDASAIYVKLIKGCQDSGIKIKYASHITGHGWRKIMRSSENFIYEIDEVMEVHPVFNFIQEHSGFDDREMYETFNMGAGYMIIVPQEQAEAAVATAIENGYIAKKIGQVRKEGDKKEVAIKPLGITFGGDELQVR
ncbi:MAG TPA: AIR synthase-related protein [Candidatus Gracilibacteria bacterium]